MPLKSQGRPLPAGVTNRPGPIHFLVLTEPSSGKLSKKRVVNFLRKSGASADHWWNLLAQQLSSAAPGGTELCLLLDHLRRSRHIQLAVPMDGGPLGAAPRNHKLEAQPSGAWVAALWWNSRGYPRDDSGGSGGR